MTTTTEPVTLELLSRGVPAGPTADAISLVLGGEPPVSTLTWARPLDALTHRTTSVARVSRVEVATPRGTKAVRLTERSDGSVLARRWTTCVELDARSANPAVEFVWAQRRRVAAKRADLLRTPVRTPTSNSVVAEVTAAWFAVSPEAAAVVAPRLGSARVLDATRRPASASEGLDAWDHAPLLSVLRDLASGAPVEWALRRVGLDS